MSVLVLLLGWIRVVEDAVEGFVLEVVDTILPGSEESVDFRVCLLELSHGIKYVFVDLDNRVLSHLGVRLDLGGRDGHSEANLEHVTTIRSNSVSESMHVGSLPRLHDGMTLNSEVGLGDLGLGTIVDLFGNTYISSLVRLVTLEVDLVVPFALLNLEVGEKIDRLVLTLDIPSGAVEGSTELEHFSEVNREHLETCIFEHVCHALFLCLNDDLVLVDDEDVHVQPFG